MTTRTRRTPKELAAEYQRRANRARAKAAKQQKDADLRAQIQLGKAAIAAGISSAEDIQARLILADLMIEAFGKDGTLRAGDKRHWAAIDFLFKPPEKAREALFEWWIAHEHPLS
jgi:hypothetical protein